MNPEQQQQFEQMRADIAELKSQVGSLQADYDDLQIQFEKYRANISIKNAYLRILSVNPDFQLRLPNLAANPSTSYDGALAVVGGKLKVYTGGAWVVVGTQT